MSSTSASLSSSSNTKPVQNNVIACATCSKSITPSRSFHRMDKFYCSQTCVNVVIEKELKIKKEIDLKKENTTSQSGHDYSGGDCH